MSVINFRTVCFSTNYSTFSSISIMKQYLMNTECSDINYVKENQVQFKHKLLLDNGSQFQYSNSYYEISSFAKSNKICDKADCFIIFYDLENNESEIQFGKILNYIRDTCDIEKKIFLITIFTSENNIITNNNEETFKKYFSNNNLNNYDISMVNMDSLDELAKVIDSLSEEILQEKNMIGNNKVLDIDNSKSNCLII